MTAIEANRKATEISTSIHNVEISLILKRIEEQVNKGEFSLYVSSMSTGARTALEKDLGYKIKIEEMDRQGTEYKISW
jgi:hypothetical protein